MRTPLNWDTPVHRTRDRVADVDGIGRYHVRRAAPHARQWQVRLNGKVIATVSSAEEAIGTAERDAAQRAAGP